MRKMALTGLFLTALGLSLSQDIGAADVKWTLIVPELGGATYVKDRTKCLECHEEYMIPFDNTIHGRISKQNREALDCENCHGPGANAHTQAKSYNDGVCTQCHPQQQQWKASAHAQKTGYQELHMAEGASCVECHTGQGFVEVAMRGKPVVFPNQATASQPATLSADPSEMAPIACARSPRY